MPPSKVDDDDDGVTLTSVKVEEPLTAKKSIRVSFDAAPGAAAKKPAAADAKNDGEKGDGKGDEKDGEKKEEDGEDLDGSRDRLLRGKKKRSMKQDFYRILQESKGQSKRLSVGIFFLFCNSVCIMLIPFYAGRMIDGVTKHLEGDSAGARRDVLDAYIGLLLVGLFGGLFQALRMYMFNTASYKVVARLRNRLFTNILAQEVGFFDSVTSGSLISRITTDTAMLKNVATQNLSMALRGMATVIIAFTFMFYTSWRLTLVVLAAFPPLIAAAIWQSRRLRVLARLTQQATAKATSVAEDSLGAIRTVRTFGQENHESSHFASSVNEALGVEMSYGRRSAIFNGCLTAGVFITLGSTFYYGSRLAIEDDLTIGELNAFILYSINASFGMALISGTCASIIQALGASTRVFDLMDRESLLPHDGVLAPDTTETGVSVELRDVHFAYPGVPDRPVLNGLSLNVPAGTCAAIVGASGAGKSTIAALVQYYYAPIKGQVFVAGVPVGDIQHEHLHSLIGVVSQEPVLFARSIRSNARFASPDATDEDIWRALEQANVADFVRDLEKGLDTWVGERGIKLSGGQKQRIAIARAVLMNPQVLLLDEATSALDAESEQLVNDALDAMMSGRNRTSIVIAHRLSTIQDADSVAVVSEGVVAEQDTHDNLMKIPDGVYANLMRRQLAGLGASTDDLPKLAQQEQKKTK